MDGFVQGLAARVMARLGAGGRLIVAIAGAPGSGKSTLAEALVDQLNQGQPGVALNMPMDGYHMDNAVLSARGLLARKGAPETFDVAALGRDLALVRDCAPVLVPVFDRSLDLSRAFAREIAPDVPVVVIEGNYLLLRADPWAGLAGMFDVTVFVQVPEAELERRLIQRWLDHGHTPNAARARAMGNDIPNARLVVAGSAPADVVWDQRLR